MASAVRVAGIGIVVGLVAALGAGTWLASFLAGVGPRDVPTLAVVAVFFVGVTLAAATGAAEVACCAAAARGNAASSAAANVRLLIAFFMAGRRTVCNFPAG